MGDKTAIAWADATWNPLRGCSRVSEGCRNCYAEKVAHRFSGPGQPYEGLTRKGRWTGDIRLVPEHLADPLRWRRSRRVFVNSMSDLFHHAVPDEYIAAVFGVMAAATQHQFLVLTKRPNRMLEWFEYMGRCWPGIVQTTSAALDEYLDDGGEMHWQFATAFPSWPLPNVWLGVSVEDQATADERIPLLLQCPAAVRFVSYEPALGPVDFWAIRDGSWYDSEGATRYNALTGTAWWGGTGDHGLGGGPRLSLIIAGGESGPGARPCDVNWIRGVIRDCQETKTACFVKQIGRFPCITDSNGELWHPSYGMAPRVGMDDPDVRMLMGVKHPKGGDHEEWSADLRVREWPS